MDFTLNETQEAFKRVAADFVKAEVPSHKMTVWYRDKETFRPNIYEKAAELGWLGMLIPEQFGGAGVSFTDCAVVFEELGRGPVPGPLFSCGVLGAQIIFEGGSEEQKKSWLPQICSGERIAVPALTDKGAHFGPEAVETKLTKSGNDFVLEGSKKFVFDARAATSYICAARTESGQIALVLLDRNSSGVYVSAIHAGFTISVAEVKFEKVKVAAGNVISASAGYYQATNYAHMVWAGPGTDYGHPLMAHSLLAHTLYQYLGTPAQHKRSMMDALYPRAK